MPQAGHESCSFCLGQYLTALLCALLLCLGSGSVETAFAQAPYDTVGTTEGWAWSKIKQGEIADFNTHCETAPLDPKKEDTRWQADCRKISSRFLVDLLTRLPWRDRVPRAGVQIIGARIVGDADLENAKLVRPIEVTGSQVEGEINLRRAQTDSSIRLSGSLMNGVFEVNMACIRKAIYSYGMVQPSRVQRG